MCVCGWLGGGFLDLQLLQVDMCVYKLRDLNWNNKDCCVKYFETLHLQL
jgi:hypothetical protein